MIEPSMILTLASGSVATHEMVILFLSLAILLGAARLFGEIARYFGQLALLGELMAGVLLGPTLFDYISPAFHDWLFPTSGGAAIALNGFVQISVALLLLVAGLEVDLSSVWRQGKSALYVSISGMVLPFILGAGIALALPGMMGKDPHGALIPFAVFIGIAMSITALPVISRVLMDLNLLKSDIGMLIMSAAMVNDLVGWIGFAFVLAMLNAQSTDATSGASSTVLQSILMTLAFIIIILTFGRWLFNKLLPTVQARTAWPSGVISFVLVIALAAGALTEWIGIHAIFGAFLAGVALGDSPHLRERTRDIIHQFILSIFAPVFFAMLAIQINFIDAFDPLLVVVVLVVAIVAKVAGCYIGAAWAGMGLRENLAVAFGMTTRGAMEMILADLARRAGLITDELFVAILIMALVTSLIAGPLMQHVLGKKKALKLMDVLPERNILPNLKALTVREAIDEMAQSVARKAKLSAREISETVWHREQLMHTGLPHQIAVPHGRFANLSQPIVVLGRSAEGIDFDAADGQHALLIFMLLTPLHDHSAQLDLMSIIGQVFDNPLVRNQVLTAQSIVEIRAALNQADSTVGGH